MTGLAVKLILALVTISVTFHGRYDYYFHHISRQFDTHLPQDRTKTKPNAKNETFSMHDDCGHCQSMSLCRRESAFCLSHKDKFTEGVFYTFDVPSSY